MSDVIEIRIEDKAVMQALARLAKRVSDLEPAMRKIAGIMHDAVEQNFEEEGKPKWKVLASSTIRQREKKGHWPGKILQAGGEMAASIEQGSDNESAWVGTNKRYAAIQHFGGKAGRGRTVEIPERAFMQLKQEALKEITETLDNYLIK